MLVWLRSVLRQPSPSDPPFPQFPPFPPFPPFLYVRTKSSMSRKRCKSRNNSPLIHPCSERLAPISRSRRTLFLLCCFHVPYDVAFERGCVLLEWQDTRVHAHEMAWPMVPRAENDSRNPEPVTRHPSPSPPRPVK